jgi:integration host factor subunit beta
MQGTVTKSELIEHISEQLKLPTGKAEQIVNCVFDSMVKALQEGEGIEIRGFGSFTVREYKAYEGRNPRTGETVHVAPKRLPFFKVGKDLRERVNRSRETAPGDAPRGIASAPSSMPAPAPSPSGSGGGYGSSGGGYGGGGSDPSGGSRF